MSHPGRSCLLCPALPLIAVFTVRLVDCKPEVAVAMLRWAYTDELELTEDDAFLIDLMKLANRFQLQVLRERSVTAAGTPRWRRQRAVTCNRCPPAGVKRA